MAVKICAVNFNIAFAGRLGGLSRHRLTELMHQRESRFVLHIEITIKLHRRHPLRCIHEQTDRAQKIDKGKLPRSDNCPRCHAELLMSRCAFEPLARYKIVELQVAIWRTHGRAVGLRPAHGAKPPIGFGFAASENHFQRKRTRRRRKKKCSAIIELFSRMFMMFSKAKKRKIKFRIQYQ